MKTRKEVEEFLKAVPRFDYGNEEGKYGEISVEDWTELSAYKSSLFRNADDVTFASTNFGKKDTRPDWITWRLTTDEGFADAELIYGGDGGYYVSIYLKGEPYWDRFDPYEADSEQFVSVWNMLPEKAKEEFKQVLHDYADEYQGFLRFVEGNAAVAPKAP